MELCPKCKKMTAEISIYNKKLICYNRYCSQDADKYIVKEFTCSHCGSIVDRKEVKGLYQLFDCPKCDSKYGVVREDREYNNGILVKEKEEQIESRKEPKIMNIKELQDKLEGLESKIQRMIYEFQRDNNVMINMDINKGFPRMSISISVSIYPNPKKVEDVSKVKLSMDEFSKSFNLEKARSGGD